MANTILSRAEKIPPFVCRLLARTRDGRGWRGLSHRDIEKISNLPKSTVAELSYRKTWKGIPIDVVDVFSSACGVNHLSSRRQMDYLRRRDLKYTETGQMSQVRMYTRLWGMYAKFIEEQKS